MEYEKDVLVKYRIERARESIDEAKIAIDSNKLFNAENRIYYSIYYIVSALSIKNNFTTSKHSQLLGWFNKNFIKTKVINPELGKTYYTAFEKRQKGDYEDLKYFTVEEVNNDFLKMLEFVDIIEKLIEGATP
jgi:uncharacterized protein (UPF0332 family)